MWRGGGMNGSGRDVDRIVGGGESEVVVGCSICTEIAYLVLVLVLVLDVVFVVVETCYCSRLPLYLGCNYDDDGHAAEQ